MDTLPVHNPSPDLVPIETDLSIGQIANTIADQTAHTRYTKIKASNTKRRQKADLALFFTYLRDAGYPHDMKPFIQAVAAGKPLHAFWHLWQDVTYGLVEGFVLWQEHQGYAINSINVRLSTIKAYCKLAKRASAISHTELGSILMIEGYGHREGLNLDKDRTIARVGKKKATPTIISPAHAALMKRQTLSRDAAMMCLLLDLGLRVGELVKLKKSEIDMEKGVIVFYREKVDLTQTHRLSPDCLVALQAYLPSVTGTYLFPGRTRKDGKDRPMTTSGVNKRVGELGDAIGLKNLSPHDCRHYLFTNEVEKGTDTKTLQTMGGWSSPAMALKYANAAEIANGGASFFKQ